MRQGEFFRKTRETDIFARLCLDGEGKNDIGTGIGFFDHMLTAFAVHAGMDLTLKARGDLQVDCHHTIEDTGIVLGKALAGALGDRSAIGRYGSCSVPMDESLAFCSLDISGRPFLVFQCTFSHAMMGGMETAMVEEFFRALCVNAGFTLHILVPYGANDHHKTEAVFKAFAHALAAAAAPRGNGVLSTKGVL